MWLRKIELINFRGYRDTAEVNIDEGVTGIVGRNDFGKSTILETLAIFLGTEGTKVNRNDMNCSSLREGVSCFEIACEFDDLPESIIIDERVQTIPASEHPFNKDGNSEIVEFFKAVTTGKPERACIRCMHPAHESLRNLMGMKMVELRAVGKAVEENITSKYTVFLWYRATRETAVPHDCAETLLDVDKEFGIDTKLLWGKTLDLLPTFVLSKVDRESNDGDSEVKSPLQQAVKDVQVVLQDKITVLENEIQDSALDVARCTLDKSREMALELISELMSRFREKPK